MRFKTTRRAALAMVLCLPSLTLLHATAHAEAYPSKPIRMVVPFAAGSATDLLARIVSAEMSNGSNMQIVVDNRPGAGGTIGTAAVAKAVPDGYTLLLTSAGHAVNPTLYPKLPYDTTRDLMGVSTVATMPYLLVVSASSPYRTLKDLIGAARAQPDAVTYSSAGSGSSSHISGELFNVKAGVKTRHIPYKGAPAAITDVMSGRVDMFFAPSITVMQFVKEGKLRILGVATPERLPSMPDVPTIAEAGAPGYVFDAWFGVLAPAGTPKDIVARLNTSMQQALGTAATREKLKAQGADAKASTPAAFDKLIAADIAKLEPIVRQSGAQPGQ
ncbi:Bug family tripartite tricarboxylate transporter substrate binding protein [Cupriavidus oxalaticus]|jgi:tripartite-type tricarboxylate transporter receptor subunit TctC|uniref:Extra-cytoplasmic solute receptor n=1 Tax=Cupriavidus oxalaticus TaxID=96344 RepID=A0A375GMI2_9BURK|nr:tripartite tricarboxylate transporter substrate binding protein [Cupriavidus oxalaticus]QEZ43506.1 tripartite tricarboxylate transporter substrate binding protein [Cupriavidus oxalaticus]QRQ85100.1 tripartite tricarboxylate transporter substrate binding protein [Cupriavidus oxalaticus]QRQ90812.1 tripartite tricarboxylate transporter substrate binding protein [Cupriavidus oxalaticus]WQD85340.1 tripartite tricarboxylate transporter substrate binding protein [Cupriavidus oxalaticus]SPC23284.1 